MGTVVWYAAAAVAEIAGCFAFWSVFRLGRSALWLAPGIASLMIFAFALTPVEAAFAGRAYAAYGGVYIAASVLWLWMIERHVPDRWDIIGSSVALCRAAIVLFGPRAV